MAYAEQATGFASSAMPNSAPKTQPELHSRAHSFHAAVEHLDAIHNRLKRMRDRLSGPTPEAVPEGGLKKGPGERPLTAVYSDVADDIENRISGIRSTIDEIERVI